MLLHDKIVSSYPDGFSGLSIFCKKEMRKDVAELFKSSFEKEWNSAMDLVEEEYGDCTEKEDEIENPAEVIVSDYGVLVKLAPLYLSYCYGDGKDLEFGHNALDNTLKQLEEKYPEVSYWGVIAYEWSDTHGADVVNYEFASNGIGKDDERLYDFVHQALLDAVADDYFWNRLTDELEDEDGIAFLDVLRAFLEYNMSDDVIENLLDIAGEVDGEIREVLEAVIAAVEYDRIMFDDCVEDYDDMVDELMEMEVDIHEKIMDKISEAKQAFEQGKKDC